ncbi:hypothetical protein HY768_11105 [candidate division TA06 bacterium]|uniref:DUF3568 family protein n=1 Tax=candidate division TA06 bacterium TaxID=2250710 RepID=A0A933MLQ2_UNCT6|nr:hypothetical protein [candidate division TA06 bacterium]
MKRVTWASISIAMLLACVLFIDCATTQEATWKTLPEITKTTYEQSWSIVVGVITEKYDLEITDAASGYLRTAWKVKKDFLNQDDSRTRISVRLESKTPLKFKIRAEKEAKNLADEWTPKGNDEQLEKAMLEELSARLK